MNRQKIPPEIQARVLAESRRRCAICFGLHLDSKRKKGQIAHLDHDPANNAPSNLLFLCFDHHDEYDSKTRQSKGLAEAEVEVYRNELIKELERLWSSGQLDAPPTSAAQSSLTISVTNIGGAGGSGGMFGGGGGGGGAPMGAGGSGGKGPSIPDIDV